MGFGIFEGSFYQGQSGVVNPRDTTEDRRKANTAKVIDIMRAGVFEPAVSDIEEHIRRAPERWGTGEAGTSTYAHGPGISISGRFEDFKAERMYFVDSLFFGLLVY
jgi:hypothetical protein